MRVSYSDLFGIRHEREHEEDIAVGDEVTTGSSKYPRFEVVAVHGDKAWLRERQGRADSVVPLALCRKAIA